MINNINYLVFHCFSYNSVFESISKTADKTEISDFPPMNCVPSLCSTGDNYTLPIENTTTTHQQHYRSGVAVGDNGNDDDDNGEIDFEDNAPDSVDKLLSGEWIFIKFFLYLYISFTALNLSKFGVHFIHSRM